MGDYGLQAYEPLNELGRAPGTKASPCASPAEAVCAGDSARRCSDDPSAPSPGLSGFSLRAFGFQSVGLWVLGFSLGCIEATGRLSHAGM